MLIVAYIAQCALMLGLPLLVVLGLRRRWPAEVSWRLVGVGALGFVASQAVHIPLNLAVALLIKAAGRSTS